MDIKRIIAIVILLVIIVGSVLIPYAVLGSNATSIQENEFSFDTLPTEVVTMPETQAPTQSLLDTIIDTSIVYVKCEDKNSLQKEMDRCNLYLMELKTISMSLVAHEIIRIEEILTLYEYDALYMDKTIINVPVEYTKRDFKSYEDYRNITSIYSPHYRLQHEYAYTGEDGIRMVNGRYCIALGSYFVTRIGQYVDIVLANGTIIPCILGDQKADHHTGDLHIAHSTDSSVVEFIVDRKVLPDLPRKMGSISYSYSEWRSPVVQVIVYDINEFDR